MKKPDLSEYYDQLQVWERIPLLLKAKARGDEEEVKLLLDSSPERRCELPEHVLPEMFLYHLVFRYIGEQLDLAAHCFFALWRHEQSADPRGQWLSAAQADADTFRANSEAWRQFCSQRALPVDLLMAGNHSGRFWQYCEEHLAAATALESPEAWPLTAEQIPPRTTVAAMLEDWRKMQLDQE